MPTAPINGTSLFWHSAGEAGPPLVLLHGSWQDHHAWDLVLPRLARTSRVVACDRRGHGRSIPGRGDVTDDVADVASLVEHLGLAPAHLVGNSSGGSIALRLAAARPGLVRSVVAHEPPLLGHLSGVAEASDDLACVRAALETVRSLLAEGQHARAAECFVDRVALGSGAWRRLPEPHRRRFASHAPTFAEELEDPRLESLDLRALAEARTPVLLTRGSRSPRFFAMILDRLAASLRHAGVHTFVGAGHVPHATHPREFVRVLCDAVAAAEAGPPPG